MASIEQVAREAGVSITTVSHVFSGKRPVAPETRSRVLAVAERLRYRPHRAARGLATGRAMIIGVHFPFDDESLLLDPFFMELLEGCSAAAAEVGYGFLLIRVSPEARFPLKLALKERRFDGVIVVNPRPDNQLIPLVLQRGIPLVTVGRHLGPDRAPWVDNDHRSSIAQLVAHLERQGYERPALIVQQSRVSSDQEDMQESFGREMLARGGEALMVHPADFSEEQGFLHALRLLSGAHPPDAIIAAVDRAALGVLRAARELRVRIPRDLGVASADDTVLARHSDPQLTSMRLRPHALGEAAVETLLAMVEHSTVPENRLLPTELVPRASTRRNRRRASAASPG
jgi:DNA-binding LacI/PurR family transcriptional regulator